MSYSLDSLVEGFASLRAVVIGDAMLDVYTIGRARRLTPEAPAPVVDAELRREFPGGAANVAANAAALGASTTLISVLGDDDDATALAGRLANCGVACRPVHEPSRHTLTKERIVAESTVIARVDRGSNGPIGSAAAGRVCELFDDAARSADLIVVSDYDYGVFAPRVVRHLAEKLARRRDLPVLIDARSLTRFRAVGATAVKPNLSEAAALLGLGHDRKRSRRALANGAGERLLDLSGAGMAAVTLDCEGSLLLERGRPAHFTPARRVDHPHVCGAGDTYLAAFALALAVGANSSDAALLAAEAAAVAVEQRYTAVCSGERLRRSLGGSCATLSLEEAARLAEGLRRAGRRVVLTGGCFDLVHAGHIQCLDRAKALGDVLFVALNSDDSVRRLKGPTRPLNSLSDRAALLAALRAVDYVVPFDESTPERVVAAVRPSFFVKGGDYDGRSLAETPLVEEFGGQVVVVPFVEGRSTTRLVARIREPIAEASGTALSDTAPAATVAKSFQEEPEDGSFQMARRALRTVR